MEKAVCKNPWCKGTFEYNESDMILVEEDVRSSNINKVLDEPVKVPPRECPKCRSFSTELSGGVEWKDKKYEGSRYDGMAHPVSIKINKYFK